MYGQLVASVYSELSQLLLEPFKAARIIATVNRSWGSFQTPNNFTHIRAFLDHPYFKANEVKYRFQEVVSRQEGQFQTMRCIFKLGCSCMTISESTQVQQKFTSNLLKNVVELNFEALWLTGHSKAYTLIPSSVPENSTMCGFIMTCIELHGAGQNSLSH